MKDKLEKLVLNKKIIVDENQKSVITSAEGARYKYFDFTKEKISEIAIKPFSNLTIEDCFVLVQALFPEYLICSGLFDTFIIFEIKNGRRIDPPKYFFSSLDSYLNNNNELKFNFLAAEIVDLCIKNNIQYAKFWDVVVEKELLGGGI